MAAALLVLTAAVVGAQPAIATPTPTPAPPLPATARVKIDDVRWISFGAGLRTSFKAQEDGAPDGQSWMKDFDIDNMRLYTSGQISPRLAATFNLDYQKETPENTGPPVAEKLRLLDAIAKLRLSDALQIWGGRLHPPSDRSNLDGPYYQATYQPPFVSRYPAIFAGRDDGVVAWGTLHGGRCKYKAGVFEGRDTNANRSDDLLFAASAMLNLWDGEPAFYNQSTYYGAKRILALGAAVQHQKNGAASNAATPVAADFTAWSVDFLLEREIGGVATVEGAYYNYDTGDVTDPFLPDDHGYFVLAGYLLPGSVNGARLQPHVRWQRLGIRRALDVGVNLVGRGHIGRLSLVYTRDENTSTGTVQHRVLAGAQFQY